MILFLIALLYFQVILGELPGGARRQPAFQTGRRERRAERRFPALVQCLQIPHAEHRQVIQGKDCTLKPVLVVMLGQTLGSGEHAKMSRQGFGDLSCKP